MSHDHVTHAFPADGPADLYVEIGRGSVRIRCTDTDQSQVDITGRRADEVEVTRDGAELRVVEPRRAGAVLRDGSLTVEVLVPTRSDVAVRTGSADIDVTGTARSAVLRSGSGDVGVEDVEDVEIDTGSGDIRVREMRGEARIKSGSGDVALGRLSGAGTVSTGSGDVDVEHVGAPLGVKTGSGDLRVRATGADVSATTGSGDVVVDRADRGRIVVKGASGDVRLAVPGGVPVWTDLLTVTGAVRSDIEPTGAPADGQDHVELHVKTVSGGITLTSC